MLERQMFLSADASRNVSAGEIRLTVDEQGKVEFSITGAFRNKPELIAQILSLLVLDDS